MNATKHNYIKSIMSILLALVLLWNMTGELYASEREETVNGTLQAAIYESADYSDNAVVLGDGSTDTQIDNWECDTDRYLKIDLTDLEQEAGFIYKIQIQMQPVIYLSNISAASGTTYEFKKNESFLVNTDANYPVEDTSGTLTYTINSGTSMTTIVASLRYDNGLWNKLESAQLGEDETAIITVSLIKENEDGAAILKTLQLDKAYAGTAMTVNGSAGLFLESRPDASSVASIISGYDDRILVSSSQMGSQNYKDGHFYKELDVEITLPKYESEGRIHYMELQELEVQISSGTAECTQTLEDGKVLLTIKNVYFSSNSILRYYLKFPDSVANMEDINFTGGNLKISRENVDIVNKGMTITLKDVVEPNITSRMSSGAVNILNLDIVQRLGSFGLDNDGGEGGPHLIRMDFDSNNTNEMFVTSINLLADTISEYTTVTYTLIDDEGNLYENGKEFTIDVKNAYFGKKPKDNEMRNLFYRGMLPEEHQEYYFKSIAYKLGNFPANTLLYHSGAQNASYCPGSYWGYVTTANPSAELITHVTVTDVAASEIPSISKDVKVVLDSTMNVAYGMTDPYVSTTDTIEAGESFTIGGKVSVLSYPYTSNNRLKQIILGVLLPNGISINKETVQLNNKNVEVTIEKMSQPVNGMYLWVVRFPETAEIGYYSEKLETLPTGASLTYRMTLDTDITVGSYTLNMNQIVYAVGANAGNSASGSFKYFAVEEPQGYDLNGNGILDKAAIFNSNKSIVIQSAPAQLEISDGVRKADTPSSANSQLDHYADYVLYELDILCENGGTADDFFYFIPVPKASETDSDFVKAAIVGMEMQSAATVQSSGTPLELLYTAEEGLTYETAQSADVEWMTADEVIQKTEANILDWSQITLMKVRLSSGYEKIENGSATKITIPFYFAQKDSTNETVSEYDYASYAGTHICWNSKGYYHYTNGSNVFAGDVPTYGADVQLQYTAWEQKEVTLTAAKDGKPTGEGAKKLDTITVDVPFKNEQIYTLAVVNPTDVNLVPKDTTISNERSNTDFAITVAINGGVETNILTENIEMVMGLSPAAEKTELTFTVYNGDALSDIVRERYVEIKLVGNNGVIIPVKINIAREMSLAEDAESAIQGGKEYLQINGKDTKTEISADSAFTAQFVVPNLIPDNYQERQLLLSNPIKDMKIVMIDWTDTASPRYYHYTIQSDTEKTVTLTSFQEMGSNAKYTYPTGEQPVAERLLFVVDLPNHGRARGGTIGLTTKPKNSTEILKTELTYQVVSMRTFSFAAVEDAVVVGDEITFDYGFEFTETSESRYDGRQAAIVLETSGLPSDSELIVGTSEYYLNTDGSFIVPIGELKSGTAIMRLQASGVVTASVQASLWVSANSDALHPAMGEQVSAKLPITVTTKTIPSVKIEGMSDRLLSQNDLKSAQSLTYQVDNIEPYTVTLEAQVKEGNGYRLITTVLNTVDGAVADGGIFTIDTDGILKLKFSELTDPGTYRLVMKVSDETGTIIEVPYNFIVKDE